MKNNPRVDQRLVVRIEQQTPIPVPEEAVAREEGAVLQQFARGKERRLSGATLRKSRSTRA